MYSWHPHRAIQGYAIATRSFGFGADVVRKQTTVDGCEAADAPTILAEPRESGTKHFKTRTCAGDICNNSRCPTAVPHETVLASRKCRRKVLTAPTKNLLPGRLSHYRVNFNMACSGVQRVVCQESTARQLLRSWSGHQDVMMSGAASPPTASLNTRQSLQ